MKLKHIVFLTLVTLELLSFRSKAQTVSLLQQNRLSSLRGLCVVNNNVAWVSGSKGTIGITTDGGKTWKWPIIKGFETADFRDIEAFSDKEAIIMSSGTPALILKTFDGGVNWQVNYKNDDKAYFLDAMDFDGRQHGIILGDPINGNFLILETFNAGKTWVANKNAPAALIDEAAFAASGTCLKKNKKVFVIVTGGSHARMITLAGKLKNKSKALSIPVIQGKGSQGAFSVAFSKKKCVIVGGDYSKDTRSDAVAVSGDGNTFQLAKQQPAGYQSCVEHLKGHTFLSTGTSGSNISIDDGKTWNKIDSVSFNVCCKAKKGNLILFAGDGGKIGIYKF